MINWNEGNASHTVSVRALGSMAVGVGDVIVLACQDCLRWLPDRRAVYTAVLEGRGQRVVAKVFLPHAKQSRDWEREWNGLLKLQKRDLPGPIPLCVAEDSATGAIWILMQCIENAQTLEDAFECADAASIEVIADRLAACVTQMHDLGVRQVDQHIANWAFDGSRIYLLDAGTMSFSKDALLATERLQDFAALIVTLPPRVEGPFRRALSEHSESECSYDAMLSVLEAVISGYQIKRLQRYQKKTLRQCTEFGVHRSDRSQGLFDKCAEPSLVEAFFADPSRLMERGERLKSGNTCTVQGFSWEGRSYVLKRYNAKSWWYRVRHVLASSRAVRSWSAAWVLRLAFIPTVRPVAVIDQHRDGCRYLLTERIDGQLLPDYVEQVKEDPVALEALCREFQLVFKCLERMQGVHGDFKATNWIVSNTGQLHLFDLDAFHFGLSSTAFNQGHRKDVERLLANWEPSHPLRRALSKMQIAS